MSVIESDIQENLKVWYRQTLVGQLYQDFTGKIGFRYEKSWLKQGFSISQQLPLTEIEYFPNDGKAQHFFVNLLPEAETKARIIRDLKIANNDFELLKAIGGECAGALTISNTTPSLLSSYTLLTSDDFKKILRRKGSLVGITSENSRPRLSLAGAQDKCALFFDENNYFLADEDSPTTHILKFEIAGYSHIPAYEYFLTKLANMINLPTVECHLKKFERYYFLLIRRYDRILNEDKIIIRQHQEDFCQALGISCYQKYQQSGGPSFRECYELIQKVSASPLNDGENLLKWQIFNFLSGNSDGHAKNLSFIYIGRNQLRLAPFYDLVCTRAIRRLDPHLAFSIGGEFDPSVVTLKHWLKLASECNLQPNYLKKMLRNMAEILLHETPALRKRFEREIGSYPALQRVEKIIFKQCHRTLKQFH